MSIELSIQEIPFSEHPSLPLTFKDRELRQKYTPDFTCYEKVIVEIKAAKSLTNDHRAQVHNYIKAAGYKLGLLVNFGHCPKVEWERIVR